MKRILFFTHSLVGGGAEKTVINLAEYINENCPDMRAYIGVVYDDETMHSKLDCVHVLPSRTVPGMSKIRKIPVILRQAGELKKLKRELGIDVCISFLPGADFLNVLSAGREKIISSVRNKESFFVRSVFRKWYIRFCYSRSDRIVAISKGVKQDIVEYFGIREDKVRVIYNPIPQKQNHGPLDERFGRLLEGKRVVINAGRLTRQKGQKYLIEAFERVVNKVPEAHLVILGEGELRGELEQEIKRLNLQQSVTLLGFVYNPVDYIEKARIFVFSSVVEGLGNVLLETLNAGIPVVSTDCDFGPRELLSPDTDYRRKAERAEYAQYGVLVPVIQEDAEKHQDQVRQLGDAVAALLEKDGLRTAYGEKARERAKSFEIGAVVGEWLGLIQEVLQ